MGDELALDVLDMAESHRSELPAEFFVYYDDLERELANGRLPARLRTRGVLQQGWYAEFGPALIQELRVYLCTDDERYSAVRSHGQEFGKAAVTVIAGYLASQLGLATGVATGAVAFASLAVMKLGTGVFCRLTAESGCC